MEANPVIVEVTRGGMVESRHRAAIAVTDARGRDETQDSLDHAKAGAKD